MKARYVTMIAEYEFVLMATPCLNYAVKKKMVSQQLRDISQLAYTSRKIEKLNLEKEKFKKQKHYP
jgi:hypothetical protein